MDTIRKILVTTDFSSTSEGALQAALGMAAKYAAELVVLHVYTIPVYGFPDGAYISPANLAVDIESAAQRALKAVLERVSDRGVKVTTLLREGNADEEISHAVAEFGADLVVVGTHARKGFARALLGSVAETVIRTVDVPVLVVHPPAAENKK
jgi:nucleotide-binding universal stress UspA family protein